MRDMRRRLVLVAVISAAACGGSSSLPARPSPPVPPLPDGQYVFAVRSLGTACFTLTTPGSGGTPPESTVSLPVLLTAEPGGWRAELTDSRSGTLVVTLTQASSVSVAGSAHGWATDSRVSVVLQHTIAGSSGATSGVAGTVEGAITYSATGGSLVCTSNVWALTPQ